MQNGHTSESIAHGMGVQVEPTAGDGEAEAPAVDLAAYARGEEDYPLTAVLAAIDRYALEQVEQLAARTARIETRRDAIAFIEAEGLVEADEVADIDDLDD